MRKFEHLTDEVLRGKLDALDAAIEAVALGETVVEVSGEGRRMKVSEANVSLAQGLRDEYQREWDERYPPTSCGYGKALSVTVVGR